MRNYFIRIIASLLVCTQSVDPSLATVAIFRQTREGNPSEWRILFQDQALVSTAVAGTRYNFASRRQKSSEVQRSASHQAVLVPSLRHINSLSRIEVPSAHVERWRNLAAKTPKQTVFIRKRLIRARFVVDPALPHDLIATHLGEPGDLVIVTRDLVPGRVFSHGLIAEAVYHEHSESRFFARLAKKSPALSEEEIQRRAHVLASAEVMMAFNSSPVFSAEELLRLERRELLSVSMENRTLHHEWIKDELGTKAADWIIYLEKQFQIAAQKQAETYNTFDAAQRRLTLLVRDLREAAAHDSRSRMERGALQTESILTLQPKTYRTVIRFLADTALPPDIGNRIARAVVEAMAIEPQQSLALAQQILLESPQTPKPGLIHLVELAAARYPPLSETNQPSNPLRLMTRQEQESFWLDQAALFMYGEYEIHSASLFSGSDVSTHLQDSDLSTAFYEGQLLPMIEVRLKSHDHGERRKAGMVLACLAGPLLRADPTGRLLTSRWLPLVRERAKDRPYYASGPATKAAGYLAEALLEHDPSAQSLEEIWKPLFRDVRNADDAGKSLGRLARATRFAHDPLSVLERVVLPLFEETFKEGVEWNGFVEDAASALGDLGWAVLNADPSGRLFRDRWKIIYQRAQSLRSNTIPASCGKALQGPVEALISHPKLRHEFLNDVLDLYNSAIHPSRSSEMVEEAFKTMPALARLLLMHNPSKSEFRKVWTRLYLRARRFEKDTGYATLQTIGQTATVLREFDAADSSLRDLWNRRMRRFARLPESKRNSALAYALPALAPALAIPGADGKLPLESIAARYRTLLRTGNPAAEAGLALTPLAEALVKADPTGGLLRKWWPSLFQEAISQSDSRRKALEALGAVGNVLWRQDRSGLLLHDFWRPLVESATLESAIKASGRTQDPAEFTRFMNRHALTAAELASASLRTDLARFVERWGTSNETASIPAMQRLIPLILPHLETSEITDKKLSDGMRTLVAVVTKIGRLGSAEDVETVRQTLMDALDATRKQAGTESYRHYLLYAFGCLTLKSGTERGRKIFEHFMADFIFRENSAPWFNYRTAEPSESREDQARVDLLRTKLPTLATILDDPNKTIRLLHILGVLRHLYPYDDETYAAVGLSPLEYAQRTGTELSLGELKIVSLSESFRRHIFYVGDPRQPDYAMELKIPGELAGKVWVGYEHFIAATDVRQARPADPKTAAPILYRYLEGSRGAMYGREITPLAVAAFEYTDGKRNSNVTDVYWNYLSERTGRSVEELQRRNRVDTLTWAITFHAQGWMLSRTNSDTDQITNTDAHHENFRLCVDGTTHQVGDLQVAMSAPDASLNWRQQEIFDTLFGIARNGAETIDATLLPEVVAELVRFELSLENRTALAIRAIEETYYEDTHQKLLTHLRTIGNQQLAMLPDLPASQQQILEIVIRQPTEATLAPARTVAPRSDDVVAVASIHYWYLRFMGFPHQEAARTAAKTLWIEQFALAVVGFAFGRTGNLLPYMAGLLFFEGLHVYLMSHVLSGKALRQTVLLQTQTFLWYGIAAAIPSMPPAHKFIGDLLSMVGFGWATFKHGLADHRLFKRGLSSAA